MMRTVEPGDSLVNKEDVDSRPMQVHFGIVQELDAVSVTSDHQETRNDRPEKGA